MTHTPANTPTDPQLSFDFTPEPPQASPQLSHEDIVAFTQAFGGALPESLTLSTGLFEFAEQANKTHARGREYRPALSGTPRWLFEPTEGVVRPPDLPLDGFATRFCPSLDLDTSGGFLPILAFEDCDQDTVLVRRRKRAATGPNEPLNPIQTDPNIQTALLTRHTPTNHLPDDPRYGELCVPSFEIASHPTIRLNEEPFSVPLPGLLHRAVVKANDSLQRQITDEILTMICHATALDPARRSLHYSGDDMGEMLTRLDQHFEALGKPAPHIALSPRMMRALIGQKPEGFFLRSIPRDSDVPPQIGWFVRKDARGMERVLRIFFTLRAPNQRVYAACSGDPNFLMTCVTRPYSALDCNSKLSRVGWIYYLELGVVLADADSVAVMTLDNVNEIIAR